jgi:CheY-like chemotaxis protein
VVEDGEQVRAAVRSILERYGYTVLEAGDAEDALRRLEEGTPVELLVTDVVLPRMGGFELARLARRARPELKVLCISGYSADAVSRGGAEVGVPVLPKPITPASLTRKVREVLDRPPIAREDAAAP